MSHPELEPANLFTEITAGLAAGSDLQLLLQRFLEPMIRMAGAQAGAVRVLADDKDRLELVGQIGLPARVSGVEQTVDRHCGVCGIAADEARLVWGDDLSPCTRRAEGEFFGEGCHRVLAVPLQYRGRLLGIYNLFFHDETVPDANVTAVLKSIGELLGLALHNARLEAEHLRAIVMHERQSMAAEVHDSIAQTLTFVKMRLPLLETAIAERDDCRCGRYLGEVEDAVGEVHSSVRQIITHFRTQLPSQGLLAALQASVSAFRQRTEIDLELRDEAPGLQLGPTQEAQVFLIIQEALANVAKHAGARHVCITLRADGGTVTVLIEDDGQGLPGTVPDGSMASSHFGLQIMNERAHRLGGELAVGRGNPGGTCVRLKFPVESRLPAVTESSATTMRTPA